MDHSSSDVSSHICGYVCTVVFYSLLPTLTDNSYIHLGLLESLKI